MSDSPGIAASKRPGLEEVFSRVQGLVVWKLDWAWPLKKPLLMGLARTATTTMRSDLLSLRSRKMRGKGRIAALNLRIELRQDVSFADKQEVTICPFLLTSRGMP